GKRLINIEVRNQAVELIKLKPYLDTSNHRSRWGGLVDKILKRNISRKNGKVDKNFALNTFLQNW
ncbi:hypothetical protein BU17DRAFT_8118, partial [Hysterangium stoloniferum]